MPRGVEVDVLLHDQAPREVVAEIEELVRVRAIVALGLGGVQESFARSVAAGVENGIAQASAGVVCFTVKWGSWLAMGSGVGLGELVSPVDEG